MQRSGDRTIAYSLFVIALETNIQSYSCQKTKPWRKGAVNDDLSPYRIGSCSTWKARLTLIDACLQRLSTAAFVTIVTRMGSNFCGTIRCTRAAKSLTQSLHDHYYLIVAVTHSEIGLLRSAIRRTTLGDSLAELR